MEEMMMVMMKIDTNTNTKTSTTNDNQPNHHNNLNIPMITTTTCPTWKLYENPYYISHHHQQQILDQQQDSSHSSIDHKQIHKLHLPIPARKIAASFWDLTFIKAFMESELDSAHAQITKLKAELESERKARKKMESLNKKLARDLTEERRGREALERVCEELAKELTSEKAEMSRLKREIDDERKMLRTAEVIREERVQMKLAEAKILLEEKFSEMELTRKKHHQDSSSSTSEKLRCVVGDSDSSAMALTQKKSGGESENPHIKRGIKGFVEFPKVVRAIGCRSSKHLGSKLESQKAQLKILLKQKGSLRFNGLIPR